MAENLDNSADEKRLSALDKIEEAQKRIDELLKQQARSNEKNAKKLQEKINAERELVKLKKQEVAEAEKASKELEYQKKKNEEIAEVASFTSKLSKNVQKQLEEQKNKYSGIASVSGIILKLKKQQLTVSDEERKTIDKQVAIYEGLRNDVVDMVKHQVHKKDEISEEQKLRNSLKGLSLAEVEEAVKLLKVKEQLVKKHERIHELQHKIAHEAHHLPEGIRNAVTGAISLGKAVMKAGFWFGGLTLGVAALGAGLHAFMELDAAGENYRKSTGFTAKMTKEIDATAHHVVVAYRGLGVTAKDAYDVMEEMANAQSDMFTFTEKTVKALSILNTRMGIAAGDSAKVSSMFEQIGGLSEETAANATITAASLASEAGISAKELFADMAKSSGVLSSHMKGNVQLFVAQAAKAKMLGTTLKDMADTSEKLLNFESSIEEELTAATFVGGQFNLSRARALAYEGKIADANDEILNQIQKSGDFRKQDYFTQQQLAKAAGKSVEDIVRELGVRDKLGKLSGDQLNKANKLVESGVDISKLSDEDVKKKAESLAKQEKIAGVMTDIQDRISGMIESVGGRLTPIFDVLGSTLIGILSVFAQIGDVIKYMQENTWAAVAGATVLGTLATAMIAMKISQLILEKKIKQEKLKQLSPELATASASIFGGFGKLGPLGIVGAIAAVAGMVGMAYSMLSKGDDVYSPGSSSSGYGSRTLMGPEGAIQLNNKDSVIAGTDLFSNPTQSQPTQTVSPVASSNNNMINALINEFRGVRADMAGGKIGVYMDNDKVTANVTRASERSTRNNFALQ
jgi:hypothetical protein